MPIFGGPSDEEVEERKRKAQEFQRTMGMKGPTGATAPDEKGIIEEDPEDIVPGGSYLSAITPLGVDKVGLKLLGRMAAEDLIKYGEKAGAKNISKMLEKGAPKALDYGAMKAERNAARQAAEEAAPVLEKGAETTEELARKARLEKMAPGEEIGYAEENIAFRPTKGGEYVNPPKKVKK